MSITDLVKSAQFMVDADGTKKAVVLDMAVWEELLILLDDLSDTTEAAAAYEEYRHDPSTARPWAEVEAELLAEEAQDG
jgi:hypothetical protein